MRVVRAFQRVVLAHRLPEKMDADTRAFASKNNISIIELPVVLEDRKFSIFDLRWSMSAAHAMAAPGDIIVIDGQTKVLSPEEFELHYRSIEGM